MGLPPTNGVIPQSPMHTKALSRPQSKKPLPSQPEGMVAGTDLEGTMCRPQGSLIGGARPSSPEETEGGRLRRGQLYPLSGNSGHHHHLNQGGCRDTETNPVSGEGAPPQPAEPYPGHAAPGGDQGDSPFLATGSPLPFWTVAEQRGSGLLQSLGVGVFMVAAPAIRCIPSAVLWGYFAFMAIERWAAMAGPCRRLPAGLWVTLADDIWASIASCACTRHPCL